MPPIFCFSPALALRTFCLAGALALVACGDAEPTDPNKDSTDEPSTEEEETAKDASTRKPDAGKPAASRDASTSDPGQIKPKDAGPRPVKEPEPSTDAGSTMTPTTTKPDGGSTPVTPPSGDGGASVSGIAAADLDMLRKVCVDEINMYRATLMLAPLTRPTPQHESCSDEGAKVDGDSKQAHGWAKAGYKCSSLSRAGFFAQNTCPGWPASSPAAIASSLKMCLQKMWEEGEPPEGGAKCMSDFQKGDTACFLAHGHYLNMKGTFKSVSCGFYDMGKNTYWMNQDFL